MDVSDPSPAAVPGVLDEKAHRTIDALVRQSYGRLLAYLAARTRDVAGAEDALSDALATALERWPRDGVPQKPEAWLLRVAGNRITDAIRHQRVKQNSEAHLQQLAEEVRTVADAGDPFPDERLKLLFVCGHPAIDPAVRTPLMLQVVLGVDAARIASAFLVSPATMSQRLVRAKNKIRDAGIAFRVPDPPEWEERLSFVLDAIYAAYTTGWESLLEAGSTQHGLAWEAIHLGRTLVQLMPQEPEALGLLALMLHCEARCAARYDGEGNFVPLDEQDTSLWSRPLMTEAEELLRRASGFKKLGRYQLEAAIQSIHASRAHTGSLDWEEILLLYEGLVQLTPGIGAMVGRAVALAQVGKADAALAALDLLPEGRVADYQPYWAARGHVLEILGRTGEAREACLRAAGLADDPGMRAHLFKKVEKLGGR
ncbi:DUF6596 domain-containing protein [Verrucomicrobium sp. BvORR106]|uniref:RNA polymerase sigma factor n=1 Tax=Verrucomicrobium sp. BvORR106 TaxID=1403819 RepID=UPI0009DCEDAD|nr:DUF6596 domain-containing protein [Verrucomicrobium sp. BvORR106]